MQTKYRTVKCNEVTKSDLGKEIKVAGWVNTIRDHGGITFIDLRDQTGIVQIVVENATLLQGVGKETVISVEGKVTPRGEDRVNSKLATGEIEIVASTLIVLGPVLAPLPFEVEDSKKTREDVRLKYRYLDLRNPEVYKNIQFRSEINKFLRAEMDRYNFTEIATPLISASSPEGARDFLVPSRQHPGQFYALPQSPQQFKQLLMTSGFDRYYQIAPCFRDEDARADRTAGEFYQLDLEMAFATQEDCLELGEDIFANLFSKFSNKKINKAPWPRISYSESLEKFGTDKPDLRNPLLIQDLTQVFANTQFNAFKGSTVKAIVVHDLAGKPRSFYDTLTETMVNNGSKGLAWIKVEANNEFNSPIAKFLSAQEKEEIINILQAKEGSSIFMLAGKKAITTKLAGILRNELGNVLNLSDPNELAFCWIVDFPLYELTEDNALDFAHNPFSAPKGGMEALLNNEPLSVQADQWDLVINGIEMLSGAVRNHDPRVMLKMFGLLGYDEETVKNKFGALYTAFQYGAPPHAGMALGIDRSIMLLLDEPNVREVIAFPLNKSAYCPMTNAPSEVSKKQLKELSIKIDIQE